MKDDFFLNPFVIVVIVIFSLLIFYDMIRKAVEKGNQTYIQENKTHPKFRQPTESDTKGATNFWFGLFVTIVIVLVILSLKGR